jgi:Fe-S cluster assembly protein SufB
MPAVQETIDQVKRIDVDQYKYGFETDIESVKAPKGLDESTVAFISKKKDEPGWMLEWRLEAFRRWKTMTEPTWAKVHYPKIDFQNLYYYSAPKSTEGPKSLADVDPELLRTYEKLGIPLREREILAGVKGANGAGTQNGSRVAVDAVFDSVSVVTTFKDELKKAGVIFCSISEAVREYPELVRKYLGSVVPQSDNFYASLNSAVFSDGSFVYVPGGRALPDGAVHLFPHQREADWPVRAHPDHRRQGRLCELPRGLHGADARRAPAARRRGRADRARRRRDQVFHRSELVSGRQERQGRHL